MIKVNITNDQYIKGLELFMSGDIEQFFLETDQGRLFLFHGSPSKKDNLPVVKGYKKQIMSADKVVCCHSRYMPAWIQAKALCLGWGVVAIEWEPIVRNRIYLTQLGE